MSDPINMLLSNLLDTEQQISNLLKNMDEEALLAAISSMETAD